MRSLFAATALSLFASAVTAQDSAALCDSGITGTTYDLGAINDIIGGNWNQLGRAQRYTLGDPVNPFRIVYDDLRNQLIIESDDGPRLELKPYAQAPLAEVPLTVNNLRKQETSYIAEDGSHTVRLSGSEMEVLTGCNLENAASFYWSYSQGGRQAFGILVFLSDNYGFGVNGNSTGARRTTLMYR
jgi:hypothetical protein